MSPVTERRTPSLLHWICISATLFSLGDAQFYGSGRGGRFGSGLDRYDYDDDRSYVSGSDWYGRGDREYTSGRSRFGKGDRETISGYDWYGNGDREYTSGRNRFGKGDRESVSGRTGFGKGNRETVAGTTGFGRGGRETVSGGEAPRFPGSREPKGGRYGGSSDYGYGGGRYGGSRSGSSYGTRPAPRPGTYPGGRPFGPPDAQPQATRPRPGGRPDAYPWWEPYSAPARPVGGPYRQPPPKAEPTPGPASYAPMFVECPRWTPLVRAANGLSTQERQWVSRRNDVSSTALDKWLSGVSDEFEWYGDLPKLALATSGGGYRSMLLGAGVVQAMDAREAGQKTALTGLYQAMTYHSGLSGGAWLLGSIAGDNYETVSSLENDLWAPGLVKNPLYPLNTPYAKEIALVQKDIAAKEAAGFPPTTPEVWGRLLSYHLLKGEAGGLRKTMSGIADSQVFQQAQGPFPIITALGVRDTQGPICDAADNATQYEFTPFEFGSWDAGVAAFAPMEYIGTPTENGKPVKDGKCVKNFDNLGWVMGASSSKFNEGCGTTLLSIVQSFLEPVVKQVHSLTRRDLFNPMPNPFHKYAGSPLVAGQQELYLVDGGQALQNNPIWPFLNKARDVEVLFVNDNSADTDENWPNGTEILRTYDMAKAAGLTRMPWIPPVATFMEKGLTKRATFFGCNRRDQLTIVYLPNSRDYNGATIAMNPASSQFDYPKNDTIKMVQSGQTIATQGGDAEWPKCLGCAVLGKKVTRLPAFCQACYEKYCVDEKV